MDIIISANDEIKEMITKIPIGEDGKIRPEDFQEMVVKIIQDKENDAI